MKLLKKEKTKAIARFAKTFGYFPSTVRTVSELRYQAYKRYAEWKISKIK